MCLDVPGQCPCSCPLLLCILWCCWQRVLDILISVCVHLFKKKRWCQHWEFSLCLFWCTVSLPQRGPIHYQNCLFLCFSNGCRRSPPKAPQFKKITHKRNTIQKLLGHQRTHHIARPSKLTWTFPILGEEATIIETQKLGLWEKATVFETVLGQPLISISAGKGISALIHGKVVSKSSRINEEIRLLTNYCGFVWALALREAIPTN